VIVNTQTGRVLYLSPTEPGKTHDKKVADQQQIRYPTAATLGKDTGFQGYQPAGVFAFQPKKKPKGQALNCLDKFFNRLIAAVRIRVEHALAGVKRCRIVHDCFRNTKADCADLVIEVACALHNFRLHRRHPSPTLNLLDFCSDSYSE